MAFVKYEADQAASPDVKITKIALVFSNKSWEKAGFTGTEYVNLFWDQQTHRIGIASTDSDDRSKFPAKKTARGVSVAAKKFFARFGISGAQAEGGVQESGQMATIKINMQNGAAPLASNGAPVKRRGRRPKNAVA